MRILITNDDGHNAEGLHLLEKLALQFTDDVCVVAPLSNQSGVGRAISLHKDIEFVRRDAALWRLWYASRLRYDGTLSALCGSKA